MWRYKVPKDWDPNLIAERFYYATIKNGKVIFGRYYGEAKCKIEILFSSAIQQMLGFVPFMQDKPEWISWGYEWNSPQSRVADYLPNMNAQTVQTIWIMCDCIEDSEIGDRLHLPLLRALPMTQDTQQHSMASFGNLQFKKVIKRNVDCITIRMCEDLQGSILDIQGDVFIRLEIQKNAK